jgi:Terminase large subunit, T4likevirus-type, N-terminal
MPVFFVNNIMAKSLDGVLTKKAHIKQQYSDEQVLDFAACMDPNIGYLHFARKFFYIQHAVKGKLLFDPFDYQERLMGSYHNYRFNINMLPRQSGKTTCASAYLLWHAMFNQDQTILVAAHKYTGAQEIMQRIRYGYELCPDFIRAGVVSYNKGSIEFDNGSRIVSATTTGNTGRGMSISLLYCDEFAFVQPNIAEEFWTSISPTLATGGRAIITSTPNSDEDTFAQIWKESQSKFDPFGNETSDGTGVNGFYGFRSSWDEHPDRNEDWKQAELGRIGEEKFRREYGCEFLIYDETLINSIKLSELVGKDPAFKVGQVRWYKKIEPGNIYLLALDPSMGTGGDFAGIQIFELPSFTQVGEWQHNITPIQGQVKMLRDILQYIQSELGPDSLNNIYWSVENNTVAEAALVVIADLGEESFPGLFVSEPIKKGHVRKFRKGFNTTHGSKISACSRLKFLIEEDKMVIYSKPLISELKSFVAHGISFKAKLGEHDDLVSALLLLIRMSVILAEWDPLVFEKLSVGNHFDDDWEAPLPLFVSTHF